MKNGSPKVSVIIPVYNGANFLRDAIDSALAQTYRNTEVLVVNDGSTDGGETERIARSYGDRIRYFHKENGGVATALNMGIDNMTGDYFSWLSHDDLYTPDKIASQIEALDRFGEPAVVYSDYKHISPEGKLIAIHRVSPKAQTCLRGLLAIGGEVTLHGCSLMIPRPFLDRFGRFDPALRYVQDCDYWFRMAGKVPFLHVQEVHVISRQHDEQDSKRYASGLMAEYYRFSSTFVKTLSFDEVRLYFGDDIQHLSSYCRHRFAKMDQKTALLLVAHLCSWADQTGAWDIAAPVLGDLALYSGGREAQRLWEKQLRPLSQVSGTKPRILVFDYVWTRGGVERLLTAMFERLKDKYDWVLVTDESLSEQMPHRCGITQIRFKGIQNMPSRLAALSVLLEVDLYIGCSNFFPEILPVYEKMAHLGIKSIACDFGNYFLPFSAPYLYPILQNRIEAYGCAGAVVWLTSFNAQMYAQCKQNGVLLPPCHPFDGETGIAHKQDKVVLAVGRFNDPIKRLDRILKVFAKMLPSHPEAALLLVGPYDLERKIPYDSNCTLNELLQELSIPEANLKFVGKQSDMAPYYKQAAVLILASDSEGAPIVLMEAGVFGLPCVVNEIRGVEDIVSDGENGFVVPQDDLDAMADKLALLLSDFSLRTQMGMRGRELVKRFDRGIFAERWDVLIRTVLAADSREQLNGQLVLQRGSMNHDIVNFCKTAIREYERNIKYMLSNREALYMNLETEAATQQLPKHELTAGLFRRIAKPLRWGKRFYVSLKVAGVRITFQKVVKKIKQKL